MAFYKHSWVPNLYVFYGSDLHFRNLIVKTWYSTNKDIYLFDYSFPNNISGVLPKEIKLIRSVPTANRIYGLNRDSISFINFLPPKYNHKMMSTSFWGRGSTIFRIDLSIFCDLLKQQVLEVNTKHNLRFFQDYK